jgi:uncharacterized protein YbaR (Trm112 family)
VSLDAQLLEILSCQDTHHAPLTYDEAAQTLPCTECRRVFAVREGIPVLLLDEARTPDDTPGDTPHGTTGDTADGTSESDQPASHEQVP